MKKIIVHSRVGDAILVNPYTRQGSMMLYNYKNAWQDDIHELYDRPSNEKVWACSDCRQRMQEVNGSRFRLPTHNCHAFSAAFTYIEDTGAEFICYITVNNTYIIPKEGMYDHIVQRR